MLSFAIATGGTVDTHRVLLTLLTLASHHTQFTAKKVGDLLERRTEHRVLKEYDEADALHAELSEMGVRLDTRLQTWRLVSPR